MLLSDQPNKVKYTNFENFKELNFLPPFFRELSCYGNKRSTSPLSTQRHVHIFTVSQEMWVLLFKYQQNWVDNNQTKSLHNVNPVWVVISHSPNLDTHCVHCIQLVYIVKLLPMLQGIRMWIWFLWSGLQCWAELCRWRGGWEVSVCCTNIYQHLHKFVKQYKCRYNTSPCVCFLTYKR